MKRITKLLTFLVMATTLQGCAFWGGVDVTVTGQKNFSGTADLKSAVLSVDVPTGETSSLSTRIYGTVYPSNSRTGFAALTAHFAQNVGGMRVIPPPDMTEQLEDAGLEPSLQPTPDQIKTFLKQLGCQGYFHVDVHKWNYSYFLLYQRASIAFTVAYHLPGKKEPVWTARVSHSAGGESDREVAGKALQALFERLRGAE